MFCYFLACVAVVWMSRNAPPKEGERCVTFKKTAERETSVAGVGLGSFLVIFFTER